MTLPWLKLLSAVYTHLLLADLQGKKGGNIDTDDRPVAPQTQVLSITSAVMTPCHVTHSVLSG